MLKQSPASWIPTVYIAEGLPYFAVNTLTVIMYTNLGIDIKTMAFFTGWLYLPWVIKPFWSPFVDLIKSKRWWTLCMQLAIACTMASVALFLPTSFFFTSTLIAFWIMAFCSATHDIAADGYYMLALTPHQQASYVGVRSTFYRLASIIGQGGLVMLAGYLERSTKNIPLAWSIIFGGLSILFLLIFLYDNFVMPRCGNDKPIPGVTSKTICFDFFNTFATFFKKKHIISAIAFMLLYRLPEAFCVKLVAPFMLSSREMGGLGLTTAEVGLVNGTFGVIGLLLGGIVGGLAIARGGLKKWLWPMAMSLALPCIVYVWLAYFQPQNIYYISAAICFEQFGYGFGFSAFMLYLIYFSRGASQTSHYAFCTAFMALGMMLPGMAAGWIYDKLNSLHLFAMNSPQGYINFFWWVMICCLGTFVACACVKIDPEFGKKSASKE